MLRGAARQPSEEVPMPSVPTAKVLTIQNDWIEELERTYGVKL